LAYTRGQISFIFLRAVFFSRKLLNFNFFLHR